MSPPLLIIDLLFRLLCVGTLHIRDSCPIWTLPAYHSYRFCIWTPAWHSYGELYKHRLGALSCSWCSLPHGWLNEDDSFPLYHIPRTYQQSSLTSYNNDGASDCKTVGGCFNPIISKIILELKGLPFVDANPEPWMRNINVAELADAKPPLFTLRGAEKVAQIVEVLRHTTHNGFPAVDDNAATGAMELHGLILRAHLVAALKKKWFQQVLRRTEEWEVMEKFSRGELAEREAKFKSAAMSKDEIEMYVDLHPLTNKIPYTVVEDMSAAKAMVLFGSHSAICPLCQSIKHLGYIQWWNLNKARFEGPQYFECFSTQG